MRIVVGGEARNVGKTTVVCRILHSYPDVDWLAVKISSHPHGLAGAAFVLEEETGPSGSADTSRFLQAGARRALWLRGDLDAGMPELRKLLESARHWIVESTRAASLVEHDLALLVLGGPAGAVKPSAIDFPADVRVEAASPDLISLVAARWKP